MDDKYCFNQRELWDRQHSISFPNLYEATELGLFGIEKFLELKIQKILDIGCGRSGDSILFVNQGYHVISMDLSFIALQQIAINNKRKFDVESQGSINYLQSDISKGIPFAEQSFDAIYSRLSLHYFTEEPTKMVFSSIYRALKVGGCLLISVNCDDGAKFQKGELIERNVYILDGRFRHFFSISDLQVLMDNYKETSIEKSLASVGFREAKPVLQVLAIK